MMFKTLIEMDEVQQILISVIAISFAFTLVFAHYDGLIQYPKEFVIFMIVSLVTIGSGFILHEMSHKLVAVYYGAYAKFRMWTQGIIFMLIVSLFGVLFAAPGAVYIYAKKITVKQNGIISIAGPAMNIFLMCFFLALHFLNIVKPFYFSFLYGVTFPNVIEGGAIDVWYFGAFINLILGLFNMIPAFPLDGSKIMTWSKPVWFATTAVMLVLGAVLFSPWLVLPWIFFLIILSLFSKILFG